MGVIQASMAFLNRHRLPVLIGLSGALVFLVLAALLLRPRPPEAPLSESLPPLFAPHSIEAIELSMPGEPELLPPLLSVLPDDPAVLAERHWTPLEDATRELLVDEARARIDALLEAVP